MTASYTTATVYKDLCPSMTDEASDAYGMCRASNNTEGWGCTRLKRHVGDHEAGDGEGNMYASWPCGDAT